MRVREAVSLAPYTTFGIGGPAQYFVEAQSEAEVKQASDWAEEHSLALLVLGGGSNLLVSDAGVAGLVLKVALTEIRQQGCAFDLGAGVDWNVFVDQAIAAACAGVECLAGVPGSVGGTPVQNVGAYGQEVSDTIASVRALDRRGGGFVELSREQCRFRYRGSLFNADEPGRYIVTRVRFELRAGGAPAVRYADLQRRFAGSASPSLAEVATAVRQIRRSKGMLLVEGDTDCRSAGSFFKNPVLAVSRLPEIAAAAGVSLEALPRWKAGGEQVKLPAAWLLEQAGFVKGFGAVLGTGRARLSDRHTLALTNRGGATCGDVLRLQREITAGVERRFGVRLEREPVLVGDCVGLNRSGEQV